MENVYTIAYRRGRKSIRLVITVSNKYLIRGEIHPNWGGKAVCPIITIIDSIIRRGILTVTRAGTAWVL